MELVYNADLKSVARMGLRVQISRWAFSLQIVLIKIKIESGAKEWKFRKTQTTVDGSLERALEVQILRPPLSTFYKVYLVAGW